MSIDQRSHVFRGSEPVETPAAIAGLQRSVLWMRMKLDGPINTGLACGGQSGKRGTGWEYLHIAIDDASRLAFTAMMPDEKPDEKKESAVAFLDAAIAWFRAHGVAVQRVMTDHGSAYRSAVFAKAIATHGLNHKRTRPATPKTNGKAERFIQTSIREWFYGTPLRTSAERTRATHPWQHADNTAQPRSALKGKPPISRIARGNALGNDI